MTKEDKDRHISEFTWLLGTILSISDLEYQKRIWINAEDPNIIDSYDDTYMYFSEDAYALLAARREGRLTMTDEQYRLLQALYDKVEDYDKNVKPSKEDEEIIEDPQWVEITKFAKNVYEALKQP